MGCGIFVFQVGVGEASTLREAAQGTCEERDIQEQQQMPHHVTTHEHHQQQQYHHNNPHHHSIATAAFHVSRPSHPISTIMSPPNPLVHHTSIILDHEDAFHVSRLMLQNDNFQVINQTTPIWLTPITIKVHGILCWVSLFYFIMLVTTVSLESVSCYLEGRAFYHYISATCHLSCTDEILLHKRSKHASFTRRSKCWRLRGLR